MIDNDNPVIAPPEVNPEQPQPNPELVPEPTTKKSKQAKKAAVAENIQELGTAEPPVAKSNIHAMSIIGQIEGHMVLPPQNKTTK